VPFANKVDCVQKSLHVLNITGQSKDPDFLLFHRPGVLLGQKNLLFLPIMETAHAP
jgi:hypothetical protein